MLFKLLSVSLLSALAIASPTVEQRTITGYAVRQFTRDCTNPHICTYKFIIDSGEEQQQCTVVDETPVSKKRTGALATTHPFYSKPCQENGRWLISWGWDYNGDFTVMTVVHKPTEKEAFFGYSHPNVGLPKVTYPDVGPNAVQKTGA